MVAYETYAASLVSKGHGYPLWEPNPGECAPVKLADVGYTSGGGFIKLFNAAAGIDDPSNRSGLPKGHTPLIVGQIHKKNPLPKAPEYISSEGVSEKGGDLSITAGPVGQAGGRFSFECSQKKGALLIMRDVAYRQDAVYQKRFSEYFIKHHRSWLDFAEGHDISLSDLILVDGCDKTSEWACAAWSEKTRSLSLSFAAGAPGISEGSASLWGRWESTESLDKNVGPQPLVPDVAAANTTSQSIFQSPDAMAIDEPPPLQMTSHLSPSVPPLPSNQCVFVRGFQMGDRTTWFKRKKTRIDVGSGFKIIPKPLDLKIKGSNNRTSGYSSQQHMSSTADGGSSHIGTSRAGADAIAFESQWTPQNEDPDSDEDASLNIDEMRNPAAAMIGYIFENSTAQLALIHYKDFTDLLKESSDLDIHDYRIWVRHLQVAPLVWLDGDGVGMFVGTYIVRMSPGDHINQDTPVGPKESMWSENINPLPSRGDDLLPESEDDVDRDDEGPEESQHGRDRNKSSARGGGYDDSQHGGDRDKSSPRGAYHEPDESQHDGDRDKSSARGGAYYGETSHHRSQLNNYLQGRFGRNTLTWETRRLGPEHKSDWKAIAFIDQTEYGQSIAPRLKDAKEEAAHMALVALRGH